MIGDILFDLFANLGFAGALAAIFLIFYFDAMIIPLIPELFSVLVFWANPEGWGLLEWGVLILLVAEAGEILGNSTLYFIVKRIGVPRYLKKLMNRYVNFLILKDERLILSNRIAPTVPFVGAFIAACEWDYRKSVTYIAVGGLVKYSLLLAVVGLFKMTYPKELAQNVTLLLVILVIALSAVLSYIKSRRDRLQASERKDNAASEEG